MYEAVLTCKDSQGMEHRFIVSSSFKFLEFEFRSLELEYAEQGLELVKCQWRQYGASFWHNVWTRTMMKNLNKK